MKKIYQTIVSDRHGNCARAVMASLFELRLNEIPSFAPDNDQAFSMVNFFKGYGYMPIIHSRKSLEDSEVTLEDVARKDGGVNGYFFGSVSSQTYDCMHAVVVDKDLNIVHDPNPNEKCLALSPSDVIEIWTMDGWIVDGNGKFERI